MTRSFPAFIASFALALVTGALILFAVGCLLAFLSAPAAAQTTNGECDNGVPSEVDADRDCIPGTLEASGYNRSLQPCAPDTDGCFVTDSLTWSSDGDPYSDYQEATGVGMEGSVPEPYSHPLVAAMPQIEVVLEGYRYTPTEQITDSQGGSVSTTESEEFNISATVSASYTVKSEVSLTGASASAETTVSASVTAGYTASSSQTEEVNWETATSTSANAAAELKLFIRARNTGGATAADVEPTFNLYIGGELVGTLQVPDPMPTLTDGLIAPGTSTERVTIQDRRVGSNTEPITLSLRQLRRLRTGAPVEIRLIGLSATVVRWQNATSNWSCGSADQPCRWGSFIQQIESRTTRITLDFGYTGDPDAVIPARYFGTPFDYRVFTGSSFADPEVTLRDALRYLGLANESGGTFQILDRPFPSRWAAVSGPARDDQNRRFLEHWQNEAGASDEWPRDLLDFVLPRKTELALASPASEPEEAGPVLSAARFEDDLRSLAVSARPKGSFPAVAVDAHLFIHGQKQVVPMVQVEGSDYFVLSDTTSLPVSAGSSYVVARDRWGNEQTTPLVTTLPLVATCADLPESFRRASYFERPFPGTYGYGNTTVFIDGDLDKPATVFCYGAAGSTPGTDYWYGQVSDRGSFDVLGVAVLDVDRRIAVGEGFILRSGNGGRTWVEAPIPGGLPSTTFLSVTFREGGAPGAEVGIIGGQGGVLLRTEDGGRTWTEADNGTSRDMRAVDYAGGGTWFAVGQDRIQRSRDDGRTWTNINLSDQTTFEYLNGTVVTSPPFTALAALAFIDGDSGVVADQELGSGINIGSLFATTDGGETWREIVKIDDVRDIAYNGEDGWVVVQTNTSGGRIFYEEDLLTPLTEGITRVVGVDQALDAVDFGTPDIGFVLQEGGPVWRTEDGGQTWTRGGGYATSSHAGAQFMRDIDMLDANIGAIVGTDGAIGATDSGGGAPTYETIVTVDEEEAPAPLAPGVALALPAPNPFRQSTRLRYALDAPGRARLAVYDALGREVAVLVDSDRAAGEHEARFEASGLASGVYVIRLVADGAVALRTVTVVR